MNKIISILDKLNQILLENRFWLIAGFAIFSTSLLLNIYWSLYSINELWYDEAYNYFYHEYAGKKFIEDLSGYLNLLPRLTSAIIMQIIKPHYESFAAAFKITSLAAFSFMMSILLTKTFDRYLGTNILLRLLILLLIILFPHHDIGYSFNSSLATLIPALHIFLLIADREKISKPTMIAYAIASPVIFISKLIVVFSSLGLFLYCLGISIYRRVYAKTFLTTVILCCLGFATWYNLYFYPHFYIDEEAPLNLLQLFFNSIATSISAVGLSLSGYYFRVDNHGTAFIICSLFTGALASFLILNAIFFSVKNKSYQHFIKFFCALLLIIGTACASMLLNKNGYHNSPLLFYEVERYFLHRYVFFTVIATLLCMLCLIGNYKVLRKTNRIAKILIVISASITIYVYSGITLGKISNYAVIKKPFFLSAKDDIMASDFGLQINSKLFKEGYLFFNSYDAKLQEINLKNNVSNIIRISSDQDSIKNPYRRLAAPDKLHYLIIKIDGLPSECLDPEIKILIKNKSQILTAEYIPTKSRFFFFRLVEELDRKDKITEVTIQKTKGCDNISAGWADLI